MIRSRYSKAISSLGIYMVACLLSYSWRSQYLSRHRQSCWSLCRLHSRGNKSAFSILSPFRGVMRAESAWTGRLLHLMSKLHGPVAPKMIAVAIRKPHSNTSRALVYWQLSRNGCCSASPISCTMLWSVRALHSKCICCIVWCDFLDFCHHGLSF